jgi:hypothetical protein
VDAWCNSVKPILEGPQTVVVDGEFIGLLVTGNASWTLHYQPRILQYLGGNPLDPASWVMSHKSLLEEGYGIGHGVIVQEPENGNLWFVGHRKTLDKHGWLDRKVFATALSREDITDCLAYPVPTHSTEPLLEVQPLIDNPVHEM